MTSKLTPEQAEEMERQLDEYRQQLNEEAKESARQKMQPLIDLGIGTAMVSGSPQDIVDAMRSAASGLQELDATMFNLMTSTAQVFQTANDRIRTLWSQNQPSEDAQPEE